jgi:predicted nuclease of predicted toxin-antitoxin system
LSQRRPTLRFFLDEGVPDSVGRALKAAGHEVLYIRQNLAPGSPDELVCAVSEVHEAILVALDADMKKLANRHGVGRQRYRTLSLLKLSCRETRAADRAQSALSLIEHEWNHGTSNSDRRVFIEIGDAFIRTAR